MQRNFTTVAARSTALGLAAALTFTILHSLGGIADRQVDEVIAQAQACTQLAQAQTQTERPGPPQLNPARRPEPPGPGLTGRWRPTMNTVPTPPSCNAPAPWAWPP
jgi:hypothetical protein